MPLWNLGNYLVKAIALLTIALAMSCANVALAEELPLSPAQEEAGCPLPRMDAPRYPEGLRSRRVGGTVRISVAADACGRVTDVAVVKSSGHVELDAAATKAARQWVFTPKAVEKHAGGRIEMPVGFQTR
jgi:TonB family protein